MFVDKVVMLGGLCSMSLLVTIPDYALPCLMCALMYILIRVGRLAVWYLCANMGSVAFYCSIIMGAGVIYTATAV